MAGVLAFALGAGACRKADDEPRAERRRALARLKDPRPESRIAAARELGPGATRLEATALLNATKDSPAEVRREIAIALGKAAAPQAVDMLGGLLRADPSDGVRAEAATALASRTDAKVKPYLAAAFASGGPKTRAAIAAAGADVLAQAVQAERRTRMRELERRRTQVELPQLQAEALLELALAGGSEAVAALAAALEDGRDVVAAAAARGLGRAGATDHVPQLVDAVRSKRPLVVAAAATSLAELGTPAGSDAMVAAFADADDEQARVLLVALSRTTLPDALRAKLCELGVTRRDAALASEAFLVSGRACAVPAGVPEDEALLPARFHLHALAATRDPALATKARAAINGVDANVATAAATYLAVTGTKDDAPLLATTARAEHDALVARRTARARESHARRAAANEARDGELRELKALLAEDDGTSSLDDLPAPGSDRLSKFLVARRASSETGPWEHREGAVALIAACAAGAVKLGAPPDELGRRLLDDEDPRLRLAAVDVADIAGERGGALRELLRADADPAVQLAAASRELEAGREGALERLAALAKTDDAQARTAIALALSPRAADAKDVLLAIARGDDAAVEAAVEAVGRVPGDDVTEALSARLGDVRGLGAHAAVQALADRPGSKAEAALVTAAVHPLGAVRAAALDALTKRGACGAAARLGPLAEDFEARVRTAAARLTAACASNAATR